ncbi:MAG: cytochrome c, partial [Xanthomonadales bacterium]|nr:cytochrome c [Xanthomonadales bacterium]
MKKIIYTAGVTVLLIILVAATVLFSGRYNVGADEPHAGVTYSLLDVLKQRSVSAYSEGIDVPDLDDESLLAAGAEHYDAMCTGCHLAPGMGSTELRDGLYPTPPNLSEHGVEDPARAFWVIKHGLKYTGMPAWGKTHDDASIWGLVAFTSTLPTMSAAEYEAAIAASSGSHSHGGHDHGDGGHASDSTAGEDDDHSDGHSHGNEDAGHGDAGHHDGNQSASGGHSHAAPDSAAATLDAFHHALEEGRGDDALGYLADDVQILEGGHAQDKAQ